MRKHLIPGDLLVLALVASSTLPSCHRDSPATVQASQDNPSKSRTEDPQLRFEKGRKYAFYFGDNLLSPLRVDEHHADGWVTASGKEGNTRKVFHINLSSVTYVQEEK